MNENSCSLCAKLIEAEKIYISEEHLGILTSLKIFEDSTEDFLLKFQCSTCNEKLCELERWIKSCQLVQKNFALLTNEPVFEYVDENEINDSPYISESEEEVKDMLEDCVKVPKPSKYTNVNKKQYTCTDCAEVFSGKTSYRNHRKCCEIRGTSDSRRNQNYTCEAEDCGKILTSLVGFNAHTAMHRRHKRNPVNEPKKLPVLLCSICGKTFKQNTSLQVHILNHQNLKPFECELCPKRYYTHYALKTHLDTHCDERKFKCETCPKDFFTIRQLQKHKLIHKEGSRKIKCLLCPKKFMRPYQLTIHMMIHSGEKPHSCLQCDKAFRFSWDLRKHVNKCHMTEGANDPLIVELQQDDESFDDFNEMEIFE